MRRNFYLTGALELEGAFDPAAVSGLARKALTSPSTPLPELLDAFRYTVVQSRAGSSISSLTWCSMTVVNAPGSSSATACSGPTRPRMTPTRR